MRHKKSNRIFVRRSKLIFLYKDRRKKRLAERLAKWNRFILNAIHHAKKNNEEYHILNYERQKIYLGLGKRPEFNTTLKYIRSIPHIFSEDNIGQCTDGVLKLPSVFSLAQNYKESFAFLKLLFNVLNKPLFEKVQGTDIAGLPTTEM